ncbi:hypothetical protein GCM10008969_42970 [Pseudomonas veronii subsp. inensis]
MPAKNVNDDAGILNDARRSQVLREQARSYCFGAWITPNTCFCPMTHGTPSGCARTASITPSNCALLWAN